MQDRASMQYSSTRTETRTGTRTRTYLYPYWFLAARILRTSQPQAPRGTRRTPFPRHGQGSRWSRSLSLAQDYAQPFQSDSEVKCGWVQKARMCQSTMYQRRYCMYERGVSRCTGPFLPGNAEMSFIPRVPISIHD